MSREQDTLFAMPRYDIFLMLRHAFDIY